MNAWGWALVIAIVAIIGARRVWQGITDDHNGRRVRHHLHRHLDKMDRDERAENAAAEYTKH